MQTNKAPEILRGDPHGRAVDWWNVGTLFYTMVVGSQPFYAQTDMEMKRKMLNVRNINTLLY